MNKMIKIILGIAAAGATAIGTTLIILAKNGKLDGIIKKIKNAGESCELDTDKVLESSLCMISEASGDDDADAYKSSADKKSQKSYDERDLKAKPNGRH